MSTEVQTATIIGGPASPFVRKVLAVCEMKGVPYRLDPIVPFFGNDAFGELSPLRRIPVFIDDQVSLCDSTVICEYLEDRYPTPSVLPGNAAKRAQARWLEEFSDTRMADVFIWRVFYEAVILPFIFQKPRDKEKIARVVAEQVPEVMDYLEKDCTRRRLSRPATCRSQTWPSPFPSATSNGRACSPTKAGGPRRAPGSRAPRRRRRSPR